MAVFHVFVDGATDGSPEGVARLADAIAAHYGLPAPDLRARLQRGRFRVKGNVDRATADQYLRDLRALGARCTIEEANAANSRPTPVPGTVKAPQFQSGLSAAFSPQTPAANLGALGQEGAALSLSSVDGAEEPARSSSAPPDEPTKAKDKPKSGKVERPKDVPLDLFAPPDAEAAEMKVELAVDEPPRKRASTPPPREPSERKSAPTAGRASQPETPRLGSRGETARAGRGSQSSGETARASQPSGELPRVGAQVNGETGAQPAPGASRASRYGRFGEPRVRFAAGVLLAVLLGFVPAHLIASVREKSAYATIDNHVRVVQQAADSPEAYAALDRMRADQLANKVSARHNAALIAFAVWALCGGAIAFAWFRKIPWDR